MINNVFIMIVIILALFHFNRENAKAKKCLKNLIASTCNYPPGTEKISNLGISDYNPFCEDNRDPGATGKDQCYGYGSSYKGSPSTAVMNMGVAQALLFYFLFLFFFV